MDAEARCGYFFFLVWLSFAGREAIFLVAFGFQAYLNKQTSCQHCPLISYEPGRVAAADETSLVGLTTDLARGETISEKKSCQFFRAFDLLLRRAEGKKQLWGKEKSESRDQR